jgi:hypothetical protein
MGWARQVARFREKSKNKREKTSEEIGINERKILKTDMKETV